MPFPCPARPSSSLANEYTLHIVHIGPTQLPLLHSRGGAIERRILELGSAQAARGHQVTAYSAELEQSISHFRGIEVHAIACRHAGLARRWEFFFQAIRDVRSADVVHFHSIPEGALLSRNLAGLKVLSYDYFVWRGADLPFIRGIYRNALRKFDALLPVSEFCRTQSTRNWGLPPESARVLHNGVNVDQFRPDYEAGQRMRMELGLGKRPVVLYVGRVCLQKGTDLLLEAYAQLRSRIAELALVVAGPAERFARQSGSPLTDQISRAGGIYLGAIE
jgi:glycosyltransferase involved in cell wall biosynthesis